MAARTRESGAVSPGAGKKAQRTRERLLAAAREVFERDGFLDTRVTDIASAAGVAHGTFYTYFTSKEDVFLNIAHVLLDRFEQSRSSQPVRDAMTAYEALYDTNERYARMIRDNAKLIQVWRQAAGVNPELRSLLRGEDEQFVNRAARAIQRYRSLGLPVPTENDAEAARALGLMVKEYCHEVFIEDYDVDFDEAVRTLTNIWARAVGIPIPDPVSPG